MTGPAAGTWTETPQQMGGDTTTLDRTAANVIRGFQRRLQDPAQPRLAHPRTLNFLIDGGGATITTGLKGWAGVDDSFYITGVELMADRTGGGIALDIQRASYTTFPIFTSIVGATPPQLATPFIQKYQDNALVGWTRTLSPDDVLRFSVTSASSVQLVLVKLRVRPGS